MPAWKDRLTEDEIFAVIMYLGSLWPDEIYQAWMQRNQQQ
jgi:mono/diheme cytochrome c family protein